MSDTCRWSASAVCSPGERAFEQQARGPKSGQHDDRRGGVGDGLTLGATPAPKSRLPRRIVPYRTQGPACIATEGKSHTLNTQHLTPDRIRETSLANTTAHAALGYLVEDERDQGLQRLHSD